MREILFFCVFVAIAAVFTPPFLSGLTTQKPEKVVSEKPVAPAKPMKARNVRISHADIVEVKAGRNGHFMVNADVNLTSVRFMVDTGASIVALRQSDAEAIGIFLNNSDFNTPISTANGTAFGARIQLDSVIIEGIDIDGVSAMVLPDHLLGVSLLGNSFLSRLERFHVSDNTLVMEN